MSYLGAIYRGATLRWTSSGHSMERPLWLLPRAPSGYGQALFGTGTTPVK